MDYDKLIDGLRWWAEQCDRTNHGCQEKRILSGAATAIENLRAKSIMHLNAADNYFAEAKEYREERNDALTELEQMTACVYYKPGGLCRYGGDDPANVCVLGPCPHTKSAEDIRADLARVTEELNDLRAQWDMYGGDVGVTETYKELERAKAELKVQKTKCDRCRFYPGEEG